MSTRPPAIFCADIGGSFIDFASVSPSGDITGRTRLPTPCDDWTAFVAALSFLTSAPAEAAHPGTALHIAVAGLVDPDGGYMTTANIPCINGRSLARELGAALNRIVRVGNDADCFVLAEARSGAGRGHPIVFGAILGTGVGGGLVVDGKLVRGAGGVTGEWGHGPFLSATGQLAPYLPCGCGLSGCIDTIGGARGIERLHEFLHGSAIDSHAVVSAWLEGDRMATETVNRHVVLVGGALAWIVNLTGASIVPMGGGLASVPELVAAIDHHVRANILRRTSGPLVVMAMHRRDSGLLGAFHLAPGPDQPVARIE